MEKFANSLATISPILVVGCIIVWLKINQLSWPGSPRGAENKRKLADYLGLWLVLSAPLIYLIGYILYLRDCSIHRYNSFGIIVVCFTLSVIRIYLESSEDFGEGRSPRIKAMFDFSRKTILFLSAYTATAAPISIYTLTAAIISLFLIAMVVKYRIYDDIWKHALYTSKSKRYVSNHPGVSNYPGHTMLRGLLDHIPRAYLYSAYAFSILGLLLVGPIADGTIPEQNSFIVNNSCGNAFVDFFYFNVVTMSTVGYGDISPKTVPAKLMCSFEIVFAVVVLATVISLMISRVQNIATQKAEEQNTDKK